MNNIGQWFRRVYTKHGYATTKWHYIQSEIDSRLITQCGRQMERDTGNAGGQSLEFRDSRPYGWGVCTFCTGETK